MRISHVLAAAVLAVTALSAGDAAAFSMQNSGSGSSAAGGSAGAGAGTNYLDPGDKLMQEALGAKLDGGSAGEPGKDAGGLFGPKSGFSMQMQQSGKSDTGASRYFSTEQNPWK